MGGSASPPGPWPQDALKTTNPSSATRRASSLKSAIRCRVAAGCAVEHHDHGPRAGLGRRVDVERVRRQHRVGRLVGDVAGHDDARWGAGVDVATAADGVGRRDRHRGTCAGPATEVGLAPRRIRPAPRGRSGRPAAGRPCCALMLLLLWDALTSRPDRSVVARRGPPVDSVRAGRSARGSPGRRRRPRRHRGRSEPTSRRFTGSYTMDRGNDPPVSASTRTFPAVRGRVVGGQSVVAEDHRPLRCLVVDDHGCRHPYPAMTLGVSARGPRPGAGAEVEEPRLARRHRAYETIRSTEAS